MARARRHRKLRTIPGQWLFTDERLGGDRPDDPLWRALARLPRGAGIVFRHYGWAPARRVALLHRIEQLARRRGLIVVSSRIRPASGGVHRPGGSRALARRGLVTASAHDARALRAAFAAGADLVFLSPVFATRSHPGAPALGPVRFGLIVRGAPGPVIALGGMTAVRARRLAALGAAGHAAIDGWIA